MGKVAYRGLMSREEVENMYAGPGTPYPWRLDTGPGRLCVVDGRERPADRWVRPALWSRARQ